MKHYKVVQVIEGKLFSSFAEDNFKVEYRLGEWTEKPFPNNHDYGLFVIEHFEDISFTVRTCPIPFREGTDTIEDEPRLYEIYECEIKPSRIENPKPTLWFYPGFPKNPDEYYPYKGQKEDYYGVIVDKVKLTKKLTRQEIEELLNGN